MHCQKINTYMETGRVVFLPFSAISPNPNQPRSVFSEEALEELSQASAAMGCCSLYPSAGLRGDTS